MQGEPPAVWMQALGSVAFDLVNPTPAMINFRTIATVLARVPRYAGHTDDGIISVAQHCVEGAKAIERDTGRRDWAAAFLLHDAHEAYMGDLATPLVEALAAVASEQPVIVNTGDIVKRAVKSLKARLDAAIYDAAGFDWPLDAETREIVGVYDVRMLRTERDLRLAPRPHDWVKIVENAEPVQGCKLNTWSEYGARVEFTAALGRLLPNTLT